MAQRTGRRVGADKANLPAHGKTVKQLNGMNPGVTEPCRVGDGDPTDSSNGHDGSKGPAGAPKPDHKGPDRTK